MPTSAIFRMNYYVGPLLAQGGKLWIDGTKIVFSPTSALDRAMGAKDVEIPFQKIHSVQYTGVLSRTFHVKTEEKTHKFEGGQAKLFWELLEKTLPNKGLMTAVKTPIEPAKPPATTTMPPSAAPTLLCDKCAKPIQPGYSFCPYCANRLDSVCNSCHRAVDIHWVACAYCGWKFTAHA